MRSRSLLLPPDVVGFVAFCAAMLFLMWCVAGKAFSEEPSDPHGILSAFDNVNTPVAAPAEALDLTLFDMATPAAAEPAESLDLSIFDQCSEPVAKPPLTKPRGTPAGQEKLLNTSGQIQMAAATGVRAVKYPDRDDYWTHPTAHDREGLIRHLLAEGMHRGRFSEMYLRSLTTAELESLHSDDHEGKATLRLTQAIANANVTPQQTLLHAGSLEPKTTPLPEPVVPLPYPIVGPLKSESGVTSAAPMQPAIQAPAPAPAARPRSWGGFTSFEWLSDRAYHPTPEPGTFYPNLGGVLIPDAAAAQTKPLIVRNRTVPAVRYQQSCPGGKCPTKFRLW